MKKVKFLSVFLVLAFVALGCASAKPSVQVGCPPNAVCGTVDFGAGGVYLCWAPKDTAAVQAAAAAGKAANKKVSYE